MDTQAFRRSLHHSDRYNRRGFDSPTKRAQALEEAYQSDLITSIRNNSFTYKKGRLNIKLAQAFGFCWGVERAVAMAYDCLLYTSPSPRDQRGSRMPSSA